MSARSIPRGFIRRSVLALSVLLFLLAQHGAWLHSLSHIERQSLAPSSHTDSEHDRQTQTCQLCLAFACFDGAVQPTVFCAPLSTDAAIAFGVATHLPVVHCRACDYLARAPPDLA